jgi:hypothetical protein
MGLELAARAEGEQQEDEGDICKCGGRHHQPCRAIRTATRLYLSIDTSVFFAVAVPLATAATGSGPRDFGPCGDGTQSQGWRTPESCD